MREASLKTLGLYKPGPKVHACKKINPISCCIKRNVPIKSVYQNVDGLTDFA